MPVTRGAFARKSLVKKVCSYTVTHTHAGSGLCFAGVMRGSRGRNETLFTLVLPMLRLVESSLFAALRLVRWYDGSMILNVN